MEAIDRLVEIMARLRAPEGCPWDRDQTPHSLRTYLLEEAYEVAATIDAQVDWPQLASELGDLLLQIVFLAQLAAEEGRFDLVAVARGIGDKLVRRHPHVFGDKQARNVADVWRRWEEIKQEERAAEGNGEDSRLAGLPPAMPALLKAHRLAEKAARAGFDWPDAAAVADKVDEEFGELREAVEAGSDAAVEEELGDLLFAIASYARHLRVDPEVALARANRKFIARFVAVEQAAADRGVQLEDLSAEQLDDLWRAAKSAP